MAERFVNVMLGKRPTVGKKLYVAIPFAHDGERVIDQPGWQAHRDFLRNGFRYAQLSHIVMPGETGLFGFTITDEPPGPAELPPAVITEVDP